MGGTSREYLLRRLEQAGEFDLVQAVHNRVVSAHAAAIHAGILRPRPTLGMQENVGKAIAWQLARITRGSPPLPAEVPQEPPLSEAKALARALASGERPLQGERRRRERPRRRAPISPVCAEMSPDGKAREHDAERVEPELKVDLETKVDRVVQVEAPAGRLPTLPVIDPELPCLSCQHWAAAAAVREIATIYLQARRGDLHLAARPGDGLLPAACCRRRMGIPTAAALIA
jgi:hypothetical protein